MIVELAVVGSWFEVPYIPDARHVDHILRLMDRSLRATAEARGEVLWAHTPAAKPFPVPGGTRFVVWGAYGVSPLPFARPLMLTEEATLLPRILVEVADDERIFP